MKTLYLKHSTLEFFIKIILCPVVIVSLFVLHNINGSNIYLLMGLFSLFATVLFFDTSTLLLMSTVLAPNLMTLKDINSKSAIFGYFLILVFFKWFAVNRYFKITNIWFLMFIISFVMTASIYTDMSLLTQGIRCAVFLIAISDIMTSFPFSSVEYKESLIKCYLIGLAVCVISGFIYYGALGLNIFNGFFAGIRNDRNYFASIMSSGIAIGLIYSSYCNNCNIIYKLILPLLLFAGIISASRTFILSLCFVILLLGQIMITHGKNKNAIRIIVVLLICFLIFQDSFLGSFSSVMDRFDEGNVATGNHRFELWQQYLELTFSSPIRAFLGNGSSTMYIQSGRIWLAEHNSFIQLISTLGLLETVIMIMCYIKMYKTIVIDHSKIKLQFFIPLICTLFCYSSVSGTFSDNLNYSILISFVCIDYCKNKS